MAETLTAHYGWTKPDPGASSTVWGTELNSDLDAIDNQVFISQQAGIPVGSAVMWMGTISTIPANWLPMIGQSLNTTTYAKLFAIFGYGYGGSGVNFNLPSFTQRFPLGSSNLGAIGVTGGEVNHALTAAENGVHSHPVTDNGHAHGLSQTPHSHAPIPHSHGIVDPGHAHSGVIKPGTGTFGLGVNNPQYFPGNTDANSTGITVNPTSAADSPASAIVSVNAGPANVSIQNSGSGTPHNNMPPYMTVIFIIKYT